MTQDGDEIEAHSASLHAYALMSSDVI